MFRKQNYAVSLTNNSETAEATAVDDGAKNTEKAPQTACMLHLPECLSAITGACVLMKKRR